MRSRFEKRQFSAIGPAGSVTLQRAPLSQMERVAKRACDVVLALTTLVLLAPLLLMTALAIKLAGISPVVVPQRRTDFDGNEFRTYKFQTMSAIEDETQVVRTPCNRALAARLGHMLRESGIDELPELLSVLRGDMSLVGPRPHATGRAHQYEAVISRYAHQRRIKPGIMGLAEVYGIQREVNTIEDTQRKIELDLWYIDNWSLVLDFKIIWRTCFRVSHAEHPDCTLLDS